MDSMSDYFSVALFLQGFFSLAILRSMFWCQYHNPQGLPKYEKAKFAKSFISDKKLNEIINIGTVCANVCFLWIIIEVFGCITTWVLYLYVVEAHIDVILAQVDSTSEIVGPMVFGMVVEYYCYGWTKRLDPVKVGIFFSPATTLANGDVQRYLLGKQIVGLEDPAENKRYNWR